MIQNIDKTFILHTDNTTYACQVMETGQIEHLYYGGRIIWTQESAKALSCKDVNPDGNSISYDKEHSELGLDNRPLEVSGVGKGDFRQPFVELQYADGNRTTDFVYDSYTIMDGVVSPEGMPGAYVEQDKDAILGATATEPGAQTLCLVLRDKNYPVVLNLYYTVFPKCDCITRFASLRNEGSEPVIIHRLMSTQLDLNDGEYVLTTFHGDWTSEMNRVDTPVKGVRVVSCSSTGNSSNHSNPFVMLTRPDISEELGRGYGFNLIYSGNHYESAEAISHGKTRFLSGINPEVFAWELRPEESFSAPQAVMTYSHEGYQGISAHMHEFVREHVVRGDWKSKERPILINSWEACYFKFTESKLIKLAKKAAKAGIELFVLDDGWFGHRNADNCSLGDWTVNTAKLPGGLARLSKKINALGMEFGIWVEPEMVSEDSDLFRAHPDWAVVAPKGEHSLGRHQMILDLTRAEVRDNIVEQMTNVFSSGNISYVKWDMNRNFSDCYSPALPPHRQAEFAHRYILGLYDVMDRLTKAFPHILFEGCASGGNRFDLGILSYMPQIWASDNTDAICRKNTQNSYSYGYPQCTMGAHVSGVPNHQTLRRTPLETRYNVANYGVLGYELNLSDMKSSELAEIREQVALYKKWRRTLQFGQLYRIPVASNRTEWVSVSPDQDQAVAMIVQDLVKPNDSYLNLRTKGLAREKVYHVYNRRMKIDIHRFGDLVNTMSPIHIKPDGVLHNILAKFVKMDGEVEDYHVTGSLMNHGGIRLAQSYTGAGLGSNTRLFQDFDSRIYYMEAVEPKTAE